MTTNAPAIFGGSDQDQHTGSLFVESDVEVDAVGPPMNVTLGTQVTLTPCLVIGFPSSSTTSSKIGRTHRRADLAYAGIDPSKPVEKPKEK
jgi:hypothetical protein